jgi:putative restriction endonuclease
VLDAYDRACAVTGERTLQALEAARIRDDLEHSISNGILLRADLRRLFESGYVTVTPEYRFAVSRHVGEESKYRALHGAILRLPEDPAHRPLVEALWWHQEQRFLG